MEQSKNKKIMQNFLFLILLTIIFVTCLWTIDICYSASQSHLEIIGLFGIRDVNVMYHISLLLLITDFLIIVSFCFYMTLK